MNDYFYLVQQRINKYERLYRFKPRKTALKLLWWNVRWLLSKKSKSKSLTGNTLNVAIKLNGGVGDILIQSTYAKELAKYLNQENIVIDFFAFKDQDTADAVFYNAHYVNNVFLGPSFSSRSDNYDLIINIQRFVMLVHADWERIRAFSNKLTSYCEQIQSFYEENSFIINNSPYTDLLSTRLAELNNKNRVNQPDILGILNIGKEPSNFMDLNPNNLDLLSRLDLHGKIYFTIQRGINHNDASKESVRSWPVSHYEDLIALIKQKYPEIKLIQTGFSETWCEKLLGVDIDLRGKTNFEELKVLLKYACLHIDYEGGYMHIRHFLSAPSVVLFGPTDPNFLGYPENINIKSNGCPYPCEWVNPDWTLKCSRGFEKPPCMYEIQPKDVFLQIEQYMQIRERYSYHIEGTFSSLELEFHVDTINDESKIALINFDSPEAFKKVVNPYSFYHFNLNTKKLAGVEYSGVYNIAAKNNFFDFVVAEIHEDVSYPEYSLLDILRVLKPNGILALKCKPYAIEDMPLTKLDLSSFSLPEKGFFLIQKK